MTEREDIAGFSLKTLLLTLLAMLLFGLYVGVLVWGENSVTVLKQLEKKKSSLSEKIVTLKAENQRLQKEFFELKQLEPKE
ncbi:MAG TPA: hypothetical protein ENJ34_02185 [Epsilonproteobacteria bacterium]|nr:hypothetical protein [Campylobacterota bacterium]